MRHMGDPRLWRVALPWFDLFCLRLPTSKKSPIRSAVPLSERGKPFTQGGSRAPRRVPGCVALRAKLIALGFVANARGGWREGTRGTSTGRVPRLGMPRERESLPPS